MKIKLSSSKWKEIGLKAGWIKQAQTEVVDGGTLAGDIWSFETDKELNAIDSLNLIASSALDGDLSSQQELVDLWEEPWQSIKKKLEMEGSTWYVWWMDGVRKYMTENLEDD